MNTPTADRRPATISDCQGCRSDSFNSGNDRCYLLVHARIVPKLRFREGDPIESAVRVEKPQCFSEPGYLHVTPATWQSRSEWESA